MTFEEVDAHVKSLPKGKTMAAPKDKAAAMAVLCPAYKAVKPILAFVASWLPQAWSTVITDFLVAMDVVCP